MFALTIDGKPAVIKTGTSIKLTRENPFLTESGDYTLDVQLPLRGCPENIEIFGALYRPEVSISAVAGRRLPFTLITDVLSISGKAVVTSVTQDEAKVQLLAGKSEINNLMKDEEGNDIYIDELELGKLWDKEFKAYYDYWEETGSVETAFGPMKCEERDVPIYHLMYLCNNSGWDDFVHGSADDNDFVMFPVFSEEDDDIANIHWIGHSYDTDRTSLYMPDFLSSRINLSVTKNLSVQPYLIAIIERLFNALGKTVGENEIRNSWMKNIFIANAKNTIYIKDILPHWTVEEFIKEIENFSGCIIDLDKNVVKINKIENFINSNNIIELQKVIDDFNSEIDNQEETQIESIIGGNIEYESDSEDNLLRLPDEVWEKAIIKIFETETEMVSWVSSLEQTEIQKSKYLLCVKENCKVWAFIESDIDEGVFHRVEVDCNPAYIKNNQFSKKRNIDITLKIIPARLVFYNFNYKGYGTNIDNIVRMPIPVSVETREINTNAVFSVNDAIKDTTEDEDKKDFITVALNLLDTITTGVYIPQLQETKILNIPLVTGIPYLQDEEGYYTHIYKQGNCDNFKLPNRNYAHSEVIENLNTNIVRQFSFTDNINPEPLAIYLIRGKRYLCQKIELTIDEKGVNPLKKGYFYELN